MYNCEPIYLIYMYILYYINIYFDYCIYHVVLPTPLKGVKKWSAISRMYWFGLSALQSSETPDP